MMTTTAPTCPRCRGTGEVASDADVPDWYRAYMVSPPTRACDCRRSAAIASELDAAWPGLSRSEAAPSSPLQGRGDEDLVLCAPAGELRSHLRCLLADDALRATTRVVTDSDLMAAQFARGPDAESPPDLYLAPGLLVLLLGAQRANLEMARGLVLQAVVARDQRDVATWVVSEAPLGPQVPTWSAELEKVLAGREVLRPGGVAEAAEAPHMEAAPAAQPAAAQAAPVEMSPVVAAAAADLGWTPERVDGRGGGRGCCPECGAGGFSLFEGSAGDAMFKCRNASCRLSRAAPAAKLRAAPAAAATPAAPASRPAAPPPAARPAGRARDLLVRELRLGAGGGGEFRPDDHLEVASRRTIERVIEQLRIEGHTITAADRGVYRS